MRCIVKSSIFLFVGSNYLFVASLKNPSLCINILNGSTDVTSTYNLMSNLSPSISIGLLSYCWHTHLLSSLKSISLKWLISFIPFPWHSASGFIMNHFRLFILDSSFMCVRKGFISYGSSQVIGKKLYKSSNLFLIILRLLAK